MNGWDVVAWCLRCWGLLLIVGCAWFWWEVKHPFDYVAKVDERAVQEG